LGGGATLPRKGDSEDGIEILPVEQFLRLVWCGELDSAATMRQ